MQKYIKFMFPFLFRILIISLMIQNCTCGFAPSDLQIGPIQLKPSKIYNYGYAELIPFPNKVFGTSYIGTDNNAYSIFIKDGKN